MKIWWMVHKDLVSEYRARQAWPAMLLLGVVVAFLFGVQMDLLPNEKQQIVGGLHWLAVFFAGVVALGRSFASEHEDGCWETLKLYPTGPVSIYLSKLIVNVVALAALQCVLVPLFVVLVDVPLLAHPGPLVVVVLLGNLGIAAVGTLLGAVCSSVRQTGSLLALLVLPLSLPAVLAASEATRLTAAGQIGPEWWRWVQLLGAFAIVYITAGMVLFELVTED